MILPAAYTRGPSFLQISGERLFPKHPITLCDLGNRRIGRLGLTVGTRRDL